MKDWIPDLQETENIKTVKEHISRREQIICNLYGRLIKIKPDEVTFPKCLRNDLAFWFIRKLLRGETVKHFTYRIFKYGCLTADDYDNLEEDYRLAFINYPNV